MNVNQTAGGDDARRRIALVGPSYPYRGGIAHFVDSLNAELVSRGHQTLVVSFRRQYPALLFPGTSQFEADAEAEAQGSPDPARAVRVLDSINPLSWRRAAALVQTDRSDLAVLNHWMPFFAPAMGTLARRLRKEGVKTVLVVHNALPHERHPGDVQLTRYVLTATDGVISLSEDVRSRLLETFGKDSRMVPHPIYTRFGNAPDQATARSTLNIPAMAKVMLFFGFVRHYKGLDILLEAMIEIVRKVPDAFLIVAGEFYEDVNGYVGTVSRLGIERYVRFDDGYVAGHLVPSYFAAADVVVQPYRTATQSGVAQIAFNYDRPVITTEVGGLPEIVEHDVTGIVVDEPAPHPVADAVIRFFSDGVKSRMISEIAKRRGRRSWAALAEEIERT